MVDRRSGCCFALLALTCAHCSCQTPTTTCQNDGECLSGYQCRNNLCERGVGDASTGDAALVDEGRLDRGPADASGHDQPLLDALASDRTGNDLAAPDTSRADQAPGEAGCDDASPILDGGPLLDRCGTVSLWQDGFNDNIPAEM